MSWLRAPVQAGERVHRRREGTAGGRMTINLNDPVIARLYHDLSNDLDRISRRFKSAKLTLIVRNPAQKDGDVVLTNDESEAAIAALRRFTAPKAALDAMEYSEQQQEERPPEPTTVEEARAEAMGILLAVIDIANGCRPPDGTPAHEALFTYSGMIERVAAGHYGEAWSTFVQRCRR